MSKKICLICAVVVITWVTLLILMWFGFTIDKTLTAILMGMSVGAIATKYAVNLVWKIFIVISGLSLVWFVLNGRLVYTAGVLAIVLLSRLFSIKINPKKGVQQPDRFKDCC